MTRVSLRTVANQCASRGATEPHTWADWLSLSILLSIILWLLSKILHLIKLFTINHAACIFLSCGFVISRLIFNVLINCRFPLSNDSISALSYCTRDNRWELVSLGYQPISLRMKTTVGISLCLWSISTRSMWTWCSWYTFATWQSSIMLLYIQWGIKTQLYMALVRISIHLLVA